MSSQLVPIPAPLPSLIARYRPCEVMLPVWWEMLSFRENRCTKYHEHLLYPGKVWVSVVPSLLNTHGDFVSLWLLFDSVSAILVSCGCPLCVALCLSFQFTSVQTLSTRPIMFVLPKKIAVVHCCIQSVFLCLLSQFLLWQSSCKDFREI